METLHFGYNLSVSYLVCTGEVFFVASVIPAWYGGTSPTSTSRGWRQAGNALKSRRASSPLAGNE